MPPRTVKILFGSCLMHMTAKQISYLAGAFDPIADG